MNKLKTIIVNILIVNLGMQAALASQKPGQKTRPSYEVFKLKFLHSLLCLFLLSSFQHLQAGDGVSQQFNSPTFHLFSPAISDLEQETQMTTTEHSANEIIELLTKRITTEYVTTNRPSALVFFIQGLADGVQDSSPTAFKPLAKSLAVSQLKHEGESTEKLILVSMDSFIFGSTLLPSWKLSRDYLLPILQTLLNGMDERMLSSITLVGHSLGARACVEVAHAFAAPKWERKREKLHFVLVAPHTTSYFLNTPKFHRGSLSAYSRILRPLNWAIFDLTRIAFQYPGQKLIRSDKYATLCDAGIFACLPAPAWIFHHTKVISGAGDNRVPISKEVICRVLGDDSKNPKAEYVTLSTDPSRGISEDQISHGGILTHPDLTLKILTKRKFENAN